jgi:hyperosmotically inducible protein
MKKFILLALGGAASALFATTPAWADAPDGTGYKEASQKAAADYRDATAQCANAGANKQVCLQQAKVERARNEVEAVEQYRSSPAQLSRARVALANAEYNLAKAKCTDKTGADRSACMRDAKADQTAALADARSGSRTARTAATSEDCAQMEGDAKTACLGRIPGATTAGTTGESVSDKAGRAGEAVSDTAGRAGEAVSDTADKAGEAVSGAASTTGKVVSDTVITTKIKADLVRDPDLSALDVHVETVKGVVMLSGFVESQKEADKAVQLARSVDGVTDVKSALKVK